MTANKYYAHTLFYIGHNLLLVRRTFNPRAGTNNILDSHNFRPETRKYKYIYICIYIYKYMIFQFTVAIMPAEEIGLMLYSNNMGLVESRFPNERKQVIIVF